MVVKIEVTQMLHRKGDLKGFQTNFETLVYEYLSQSDTCQLDSA